jgi:hypothetical protein
MLVHPASVHTSRVSPLRFIRKMADVLQRQGQIEPLQVQSVDDKFITFECDTHGDDIVHAARYLGWSTILVCVTNRFEY